MRPWESTRILPRPLPATPTVAACPLDVFGAGDAAVAPSPPPHAATVSAPSATSRREVKRGDASATRHAHSFGGVSAIVAAASGRRIRETRSPTCPGGTVCSVLHVHEGAGRAIARPAQRAARCSTGCSRRCAAGRAGCWWWPGSLGWARRRCWSTRSSRRRGSGSRGPSVSSGRWSSPFAALQQLCAPMLDRLGRLPAPQREALGVAFGRECGGRAGSVPGRARGAEPVVGGGRRAAAPVRR